MLELFSGRRIISDRFKKGGWEVETVDLIDGIDIMDWQPKGKYDFIWASPPCTEYSGLAYDYSRIWKADRTLWLRTLELIYQIKPKFWIIENVKMAQWVWGKAPQHYGSFFLWGWYPKLNIPKGLWTKSFKGTHLDRNDNNRRFNEDKSAEDRAEIPSGLAELVFKTIDKKFTNIGDKRA